jgi:hypothetical protein
MKPITNTLKSLPVLTIAVTLVLGANMAYATWSNPPSSPPNNNADAPINVGSAAQSKTGNLGVVDLHLMGYSPEITFSDTSSGARDMRILVDNSKAVFRFDSEELLTLNPGIPNYLRIHGQARASEYCDETGNNCFTASSVGGSFDPSQFINTGSATQVKAGNLGVKDFDLVDTSPTIHFVDTNDNNMRIQVTDDELVLRDTTNSEDIITATADGTNYVRIHGQARANIYCDRDGNNCFEAGAIQTIINDISNIYKDIDIINNFANNPSANARWSVGSFGSCQQRDSRAGGPKCKNANFVWGMQTRTVRCVDSMGRTINDSNCSQSKPSSISLLCSLPDVNNRCEPDNT